MTGSERVAYERWQKAQTWERAHWLRNHRALGRYGKNYVWRLLSAIRVVEKYRGNDRNIWWQQAFEGYKALPPVVDKAIEVGCGPYTNMRLIRRVCQPRETYLSDPLIHTYVNFKMTFVHDAYRTGACHLDDHPLESLPYADASFDLAVMINVLDHVQDARACMETLVRIVRPGGFCVIGQDLTSADDLARHPEGLTLGHPITVDKRWVEAFTAGRFEPVLARVLPREAGWAPQWHYGTLAYIGRKT